MSDEIKLLIVRYLTDGLTDSESLLLRQWIDESEWNSRFFNEINSVWYASGTVGNPHFDAEKAWQEVFQRLQAKKNEVSPSANRVVFFSRMLRYAAVVMLALLVGGVISYYAFCPETEQSEKMVEFSISPGSKSSLLLSDGTHVWLNAGSVIRYSSQFGRGGRTVELEGEAYFEVAKNTKKPFLVNTDKLSIKVLGTKFNVRSYCGENIATTTLVEGSVDIKSRMSATGIVLLPGQQLVFDINRDVMNVQEVDPALFTAWLDGKIFFRQTPIDEVFSELERHFAIKIISDLEIYSDRKITGRFDLEKTPEDILDIIQETMPFAYKRINDTIYIK